MVGCRRGGGVSKPAELKEAGALPLLRKNKVLAQNAHHRLISCSCFQKIRPYKQSNAPSIYESIIA